MLAVLVVALTFTGASGHVTAKHAYLGAFTSPTFPAPAVFYGQDLTATEGGRVIAVGTVVNLTCFALVKNAGQGHVFRAFGAGGGTKYGFEVTDTPTVDTLKIWARSTLTNKATCKFGVTGSAIRTIGAGAAIG